MGCLSGRLGEQEAVDGDLQRAVDLLLANLPEAPPAGGALRTGEIDLLQVGEALLAALSGLLGDKRAALTGLQEAVAVLRLAAGLLAAKRGEASLLTGVALLTPRSGDYERLDEQFAVSLMVARRTLPLRLLLTDDLCPRRRGAELVPDLLLSLLEERRLLDVLREDLREVLLEDLLEVLREDLREERRDDLLDDLLLEHDLLLCDDDRLLLLLM
jgi:hypothetical protein